MLFLFVERAIFSASHILTHVTCASTSTCARDLLLDTTLIFPVTAATNLCTHYIYGSGIPSPCALEAIRSPQAASCSLLLGTYLLRAYRHPPCSLVLLFRLHPGNGVAGRVRFAFALCKPDTVLLTEPRRASIPLPPVPSAFAFPPSCLLYLLSVSLLCYRGSPFLGSFFYSLTAPRVFCFLTVLGL